MSQSCLLTFHCYVCVSAKSRFIAVLLKVHSKFLEGISGFMALLHLIVTNIEDVSPENCLLQALVVVAFYFICHFTDDELS